MRAATTRARFALLLLPLLAAPPLALAAQDVRADSAAHASSGATSIGVTAALILAGAAGAQTIRTPKAWPRTIAGFGQRVADQTGFYVAQTGGQRGLEHLTGWRTDTRPCGESGLVSCAFTRTFVARGDDGRGHPHLPFVASVAGATALSLAWRPERHDAAKARGFVATRLAIVYGGFVAERVVLGWWDARQARRARQAR